MMIFLLRCDAFSSINSINSPVTWKEIATQSDKKFLSLLRFETSLLLILLPGSNHPLYCYTSQQVRSYVPSQLRRQIFDSMTVSQACYAKRLSCKGKTMYKMTKSNISQHVMTPIGKFEVPLSRFFQVHIDIVALLPPSIGFRYFERFDVPRRLTSDQGK